MSDDKTDLPALREAIARSARASSVRSATRGKEDIARAKLIAADRLLGNMSIAELAKSYGIGQKRVLNALSAAERVGFYEDVERVLMAELLPEAVAVYQLHLRQGSLDAARDVMFGLGALRKNAEMAIQVNPAVDDINAYRSARKPREPISEARGPDQAEPGPLRDGGGSAHLAQDGAPPEKD